MVVVRYYRFNVKSEYAYVQSLIAHLTITGPTKHGFDNFYIYVQDKFIFFKY